ncbi:AAA family ATPase, partial [uncultured Treponema sp.]|uniref:AAA family ATPase n=1 Tax=uncultured Treponema sp. TaxID=162155 RepID=UPI0025EA8715
MIKSIKIHALKSIKDLSINCSNFTVLVGTNSSGKSTILQALLLTAQNAIRHYLYGLNGPLVNLGTFSEIYSNFCSKLDAKIKVSVDNENIESEVEIKEGSNSV